MINLARVAIGLCAVPGDVGCYASITRGSRKSCGGRVMVVRLIFDEGV